MGDIIQEIMEKTGDWRRAEREIPSGFKVSMNQGTIEFNSIYELPMQH